MGTTFAAICELCTSTTGVINAYYTQPDQCPSDRVVFDFVARKYYELEQRHKAFEDLEKQHIDRPHHVIIYQ